MPRPLSTTVVLVGQQHVHVQYDEIMHAGEPHPQNCKTIMIRQDSIVQETDMI